MATENKIFLTTALVYIAGVEAPVHEINVSYGAGTIPEAQITMPACEELIRFGREDRVPVAIFYLDEWYSEDNKATSIKPTYRLLFDGEITGWTHQRSAHGDSIIFSCSAHCLVMSQMFAKFLNPIGLGGTVMDVESFGTVQGVISDKGLKQFPLSLLKRGMFRGGHDEMLERPFDFIDNMLLSMRLGGYPHSQPTTSEEEKITVAEDLTSKKSAINPNDGTYSQQLRAVMKAAEEMSRIPPDHYKEFIRTYPRQSAAMSFFVMYNHRTKFYDRWGATPLEEFLEADAFTEVNNIRDPSFKEVLKYLEKLAHVNMLESMFGEGHSFWEILQITYSIFVYEIMMLPNAPYSVVGGRTQIDAGIPVEQVTDTDSLEQRLLNYISKPIAYFALPPECNIIFPSMLGGFGYSENYSQQVTRTVGGSPYLAPFNRQSASANSKEIEKYYTSNAWPPPVRDLVKKSKGGNINDILLFPEEYFKGPIINHITMPAWYYYLKEAAVSYETDRRKAEEVRNLSNASGWQVPMVPVKETVSMAQEIQKDAEDYNKTKLKVNEVINREAKERDNEDIYHRYTRMKYHEGRYSPRRGAQNLAFNPYILPCNTFVMLDNRSIGLHLTGYVTNISHSISASGGKSTHIEYGYARTLQEAYEGAIQHAIDTVAEAKQNTKAPEFDRFYSMSPILPSYTLSNHLQEVEGAQEYFRRTYYQGSEDRDYVFDFKKYFHTTPYEGQQIPTASSLPDNPALGYDVTLKLKEDAKGTMKKLTENYDWAMQKVARPVCTLDEYIQFINGGRSIESIQNESKDTARESAILKETYGVAVPKKIRTYLSTTAVNDATMEKYITPTTTPNEVYADMRMDWVSRIERYREKVYNKEIR